MTFGINKSDSVGILSSSLCLLHCLATPFLFVAQTQIFAHAPSKPIWWSSLDFVFIIISAFAIYFSSKNTSKKWISVALWISWFLLLFIIANEKVAWFTIPEFAIYFPSATLIFLHWYGGKFCQCKDDHCCVN